MKKYLPIITLVLTGIFLCFQNYTPGTFLSGWDTLHPEFNFGLAIKRELLGVFRAYQGLGAVAAHSDMADLPRIILLFVLSPIIPMSFLRYFYMFLTLILGPIGMYYFLKRVVFSKIPKENTVPSFIGSFFYLLNLGTMQQFFVPFEMFTTQYASLPWLFLFATEYLQNKIHQGKALFLFAIISLLSSPMAYAATLWYVNFIALIVYLGMLILFLRQKKRDLFDGIKKAFILILLTLLINSFWILPNIYFVLNHAQEVTQANINKLFSPKAFLYNKEFGNISDISLLKTFLFDWSIYSGNHQFTQLLSPWIVHFRQPFVQILGYLFATLTLFGILSSILRKNKILLSLLPLLFLCLLFLFNDNFPTSVFYKFLADKIPFFKEVFRFPQDKVLGIFTFVFVIYFATGQLLITRLIASIKHQKGWRDWRASHRVPAGSLRPRTSDGTKERQDPDGMKLYYAQVFIFVILIVYFMLPAFKGQFISPHMRVKIPEYYFEMFKWFDKEPQGGRIAHLPIHSLWGWEYYDWPASPSLGGPASPPASPSLAESRRERGEQGGGFQGAGFIWFGIEQPFLARDFDRWSPYNEQYYREMSYAIYSQNPDALKIVIEKYNIKYILIDKSIIAPDNNSKVLLYKESQVLLDKLDNLEKIKEFGNTIFVYKVKSDTPNNSRVIQNPAFINYDSKAYYEDVVYKDFGNYVTVFRHSGKPKEHPESPDAKSDSVQARMTDFEKTSSIYYPLLNLIDNQGKILPNKLQFTHEGIVVKLPKDSTMNFDLPSYLDIEESIPAEVLVEKNQNELIISLYPLFPALNIKQYPAPIVTETNFPQENNAILTINKKNTFLFNIPADRSSIYLGTILLNTKKENSIALYKSTPNEKIFPDLLNIKYLLAPCEKQEGQKVFGIENAQYNSFIIFGKNIPLCMTIPMSEVIRTNLKTPEALLNITFNYKSKLPLKFCIAKLINSACLNYNNNRLNQYFFGLQNQDLRDTGLQFRLDATNSDYIEKAYFDNLTLSLTNPFFIKILASDSLKNSLGSIDNNPSKRSTLTLPYSSNRQLRQDITKLPKTNGFCPNAPFSNSPLTKKQILKDNNENFIRYESIDGLSCDHFSYQNLSQNDAYLLTITSRNVKGLPSTICVTNTISRHCDIYTTLSPNKDFNTDFFLLPPFIKNENGFDINIGNLGIKKSPSINDLKSIEIIPIPYKWLTHIRHSGESRLNRGDSRISNVLVLPQSFEKGWKAYRVQSSKFKVQSWLNNSFPFIFGKELKEHVIVNGWANGWILDSSTMEQFNPEKIASQFNGAGNKTIVTLFLPQYLEYLGFILLLGTFAWLIKKI